MNDLFELRVGQISDVRWNPGGVVKASYVCAAVDDLVEMAPCSGDPGIDHVGVADVEVGGDDVFGRRVGVQGGDFSMGTAYCRLGAL